MPTGWPFRTSFAKNFLRVLNRRQPPPPRLLGNDGQLDLALLNVEDRVRRKSSGENDLILPYDEIVFPSPTLARNFLGSKNEAFDFLPAMEASLLARKGCRLPD